MPDTSNRTRRGYRGGYKVVKAVSLLAKVASIFNFYLHARVIDKLVSHEPPLECTHLHSLLTIDKKIRLETTGAELLPPLPNPSPARGEGLLRKHWLVYSCAWLILFPEATAKRSGVTAAGLPAGRAKRSKRSAAK